ncbi:hypothetical protein PAU_00594 [Photorhabdus asymbiotica]|uniref:Uncharacterized protein n=1 Tax=Photorhabdus asymbiotica subsp. asymbiotica (strain ATCC 43949 / 3105-77) TaxID=553480 RepID=C7BKK0_PHOAA|nr:hypothetical protein PAU_00594 [Photorhabdus asymbiotica]
MKNSNQSTLCCHQQKAFYILQIINVHIYIAMFLS